MSLEARPCAWAAALPEMKLDAAAQPDSQMLQFLSHPVNDNEVMAGRPRYWL